MVVKFQSQRTFEWKDNSLQSLKEMKESNPIILSKTAESLEKMYEAGGRNAQIRRAIERVCTSEEFQSLAGKMLNICSIKEQTEDKTARVSAASKYSSLMEEIADLAEVSSFVGALKYTGKGLFEMSIDIAASLISNADIARKGVALLNSVTLGTYTLLNLSKVRTMTEREAAALEELPVRLNFRIAELAAVDMGRCKRLINTTTKIAMGEDWKYNIALLEKGEENNASVVNDKLLANRLIGINGLLSMRN